MVNNRAQVEKAEQKKQGMMNGLTKLQTSGQALQQDLLDKSRPIFMMPAPKGDYPLLPYQGVLISLLHTSSLQHLKAQYKTQKKSEKLQLRLIYLCLQSF